MTIDENTRKARVVDRVSKSGVTVEKMETDVYPHKAKDSTDTTGTIGL